MHGLRYLTWLYWPTILAMAVWVFVWPLAVSAEPLQPLPWWGMLITLVIYLLALFTRLLRRARENY